MLNWKTKYYGPNCSGYSPHTMCTSFIHSHNFDFLLSSANMELCYIFKYVIDSLYCVFLSFFVLSRQYHKLFFNTRTEFNAAVLIWAIACDILRTLPEVCVIGTWTHHQPPSSASFTNECISANSIPFAFVVCRGTVVLLPNSPVKLHFQ
jgi:hypothetical protein